MPEHAPPVFDPAFRATLAELVAWRRDVRRFKTDAVAPELITGLIELARQAPSVGNCQPWRFVLVQSEARREKVRESFARSNEAAAQAYDDAMRADYLRLKLAGLDRAPVQLAVFADEGTDAGRGLGRQSMPEMLRYSVVGAIQTLWLVARAHGLGLGWVSILEPEEVSAALDVPDGWALIGYLCIGWPEEEHVDPELQRHSWQARHALDDVLLVR